MQDGRGECLTSKALCGLVAPRTSKDRGLCLLHTMIETDGRTMIPTAAQARKMVLELMADGAGLQQRSVRCS